MGRFGKAVAACMMFGGVATANADENYYEGDLGNTTVGTPAVSEVGSHTANVSFTYSIDPSILPKVASVCFAVEVMRVTSIKPINLPQFGGNPQYSEVNCQGGASDLRSLVFGLCRRLFSRASDPSAGTGRRERRRAGWRWRARRSTRFRSAKSSWRPGTCR